MSDPAALPADVRQKLLLLRTALICDASSEAHHWLYAIACPSFTCLDPWAALEGRQRTCGPHRTEDHLPLPTIEQIEAVLRQPPETGKALP